MLNQLIMDLKCLPGVGVKSAQRMALHILQRNRDGGLQLSQTLTKAINTVGNCKQCRTLCELENCSICTNLARDANVLCIVETPLDIIAIE